MAQPFTREDTAQRYDAARALTPETAALWMETLRSLLPAVPSRQILDLGCGTGRFTALLRAEFACPVIGVDPSAAMLAQAQNQNLEGVSWQIGSAENIPLNNDEVDLVWMSQVVHHLEQPAHAVAAIRRVLRPAGCLAIRNVTRDHRERIEWLKCFPEAQQIDDRRIPSQQEIVDLVCSQGFQRIAVQTVNQFFAASYAAYYDKIQQRSLSALITMSDEAFRAGLARLKQWVDEQPPDQPVYEPLDLFIFQVNKEEKHG